MLKNSQTVPQRLPVCKWAIILFCLAASSGCHRDAGPLTSSQPDFKTAEIYEDTVMNQERVWDDHSRDNLRDSLRDYIRGHLRLMKYDHATIVDVCREIYIEDQCPKSEWDTYNQFVATELQQSQARIDSEKTAWPVVTDSDRLDGVEEALRDRGILLWQASPCCDTCTLSELGDRIKVINDRHPGVEERLRGYAFFIDQNLPENLSEGTEVSVCLGYGWFSPDNSEVSEDVYKSNAIGIGREVAEALREVGFEVDWNQDLSHKICFSLNWQRREILD